MHKLVRETSRQLKPLDDFLKMRKGILEQASGIAQGHPERNQLFNSYAKHCADASRSGTPHLRALAAHQISRVIRTERLCIKDDVLLDACRQYKLLIIDPSALVRLHAIIGASVSPLFILLAEDFSGLICGGQMEIGEVKRLSRITRRFSDLLEGYTDRSRLQALEDAVDMIAYELWANYEKVQNPDIVHDAVHAIMCLRSDLVSVALGSHFVSVQTDVREEMQDTEKISISNTNVLVEVLEFIRARKAMQAVDSLLNLLRFRHDNFRSITMDSGLQRDITKTLLVLGVPFQSFEHMLQYSDGLPGSGVITSSELLQ